MSLVNENLKQLKLDQRQIRAWEMLSSHCEIRIARPNEYLVKSQSRKNFYNVRKLEEDDWTCECPDYSNRKVPCKHIHAVRLSLSRKRLHLK